jgi:Tol biopolymer transport system component
MAARLPGGAPVRLAQSGIPGAALLPGDVQQIQWSPDGRWVAFVVGAGLGEGHALSVVSTTGADATRVVATCPAPGFLSGLAWSPTSDSIAFDCTSSFDGRAQLITVSADGTHLTNLLSGRPLTYVGYYSPGKRAPEWSPDGFRLLFEARRVGHRRVHVWTIRADGSHLTQIG